MPSITQEAGSDSDSDCSIGYINGFDEDEETDSHPKVVAVEDTTKNIEDVFSSGQLCYLHSLKVQYLELRKEKRAEFALKVAGKLIKHMQKHGLAKEEKAKAQVRMKVRLWFQQNCRQKKDMPAWARAWTGRWVLYHENPDVVKRKWVEIRRENGEDIPDIPPDEDYVSEEEEDLVDEQDDKITGAGEGEKSAEGGDTAGGTAPARPPVGYFQQALSAAWKALSRAEQMEYERKAMQWCLDGPNEEMQRTLAGKKLPRIALHFAETIFKQMGVCVFMLVTYKHTDESTVVATMEFNGKPSFGGKSFMKSFGKQFDESGIMGLWGAYAKETVVTKEEVVVDPKLLRRTGKPLLQLELNRYGEPRIPNPSYIPPGEQANQYLPQVIRNIVIYNYARSSGREPNRTVPPWSEIVADLRTFISPEYLPDELAKHFKEPSAIKVGAARDIISFWRGRQAEKKIPLNIHNYVNESGQVVPREPRQHVDGFEDLASDYRISDEETDPSPKVNKSRATKGNKKGCSATGKGSRMKYNIDVGASEIPPGQASALEETKVGRGHGKAVLRRVVDSDEEGIVEPLKRVTLGSPFATPPPDPAIPLSPTTPSNALHNPSTLSNPSMGKHSDDFGLTLEAELALLSDDMKRVVLDVLHHHRATDSQLVTTSNTPAQTQAGPSGIKQSTSPLPPVAKDTDPSPIKQSDSPVPEPPKARRKGKGPAVLSGDSDRVPTRRRRTEEEELLEMAASAGAKSGPRKSKRSSKLRG